MNLFHLAIRDNNLTTFAAAFEAYKNVNSLTIRLNEPEAATRMTPIQLAICLGRFDMALQLLMKGADPKAQALDTDPLTDDLIKTRTIGNLFRDLIIFATGNFGNVWEHEFAATANPAVFHILLYTALTTDADEFALKLLNHVLTSLPEALSQKIIKNLTGALLFSAQQDKRKIATKLVELGTPKFNHHIRDQGAELISWLRTIASPTEAKDQEDSSAQIHSQLQHNDFIRLKKNIANINLQLPIDAISLPWILLKGHDVFVHINLLIEQRKWDEITLFAQNGYSMSGHLYQMLSLNSSVDVLPNLREYLGFGQHFNSHLRQQFIYAACDSIQVNEKILKSILAEAKEEASEKTQLTLLEAELIKSGACAPAIDNFKTIKKSMLTMSQALEPFKLNSQSTDIIHLISTFLNPKEIYTALAGTSKIFAELAHRNKLAYASSFCERFGDIYTKIATVRRYKAEFQPYKYVSFKSYLRTTESGVENVDTPLIKICISGGATSQLGFIPLACIAKPTMTLLIVSMSTASALGCAVAGGYFIYNYHAKIEIPSYKPTELTPELQTEFNEASRLFSGAIFPENIKTLMTILETEEQHLLEIKSAYQTKTKSTLELKQAPTPSPLAALYETEEKTPPSTWDSLTSTDFSPLINAAKAKKLGLQRYSSASSLEPLLSAEEKKESLSYSII